MNGGTHLTQVEREQELKAALERLHIAAENFYRGRGYLDAFRLKCALNGTRKIARGE